MTTPVIYNPSFVPRGYRNNNPFNIKKSSSRWQGKIKGDDKVFETFGSLEFGLRAGLKLLINYVHQGHDTIDKIISRFAPSCENNTDNYKRFVCDYTGLALDDVVDSIDKLIMVAVAIIKFENGYINEFLPNSISLLSSVISKFNLKL